MLSFGRGLISNGKNKTEPTQQNKPSPASSLNINTTFAKLKQLFPQYKVSFIANTNSMEPLIDYNCITISENITNAVLKKQPLDKGDIVIYDRGRGRIIHELIEPYTKNNVKGWIIKGQNNFTIDGFIETQYIKQRVVSIWYTQRTHKGD